jgi:hypothetical protein
MNRLLCISASQRMEIILFSYLYHLSVNIDREWKSFVKISCAYLNIQSVPHWKHIASQL